jgi:Peptidase_C39 like family
MKVGTNRLLPEKMRMTGRLLVVLSAAAVLLAGCVTSPHSAPPARNRFIGFTDFSRFQKTPGATSSETVWTSREIAPPNAWNELIVSWNVPAEVWLKVEARGIYPDHTTKFYTLGEWSTNPAAHPRASVEGQEDVDGTVRTDTLVMNRPGAKVQLRITLGTLDTNDALRLKFLGLSFCDSSTLPASSRTNHAAWGKIFPVPERVQSGFEGPGGWCSPASLSMVLAYWSARLNRPELDRTVPEVAAAVDDPVYGGTGNWPFNTAFAGTFPGLRAYVTRLDDVSELEDWIAAGVPVVLSVSSYLTNDRHDGPDNGHLIVCVGFTEQGDVVANDPGVSLRNGQHVRRVYPRERMMAAWKKSKNAVYLVYPDNEVIPRSRAGHWEKR